VLQWPSGFCLHTPVTRPMSHATDLVTMLTVKSVQVTVTTGHRRCPCQGRPYPFTRAQRRAPPLSFPPRLPLVLFSASLSPAALLHVTGQLCPPSSPTKPVNNNVVSPSTCSSNRKPELPASDARWSCLSSRRFPLATSPSTAAVRAPPAPPPHPGGLCGSIVRPRLHLWHRRAPVWVTVDLSSAIEFLPVSAVSASPSNHPPSLPLVQASSPATPCPTSSPVMAGIVR
jgi:hypothetical protein